MRGIFDSLEDEEKLVIFALGSLNNTPLRGKIKLQKLLFLISNVFKEYKDLLEFEPHLFGPYSETLDNIVGDLIKLGLVEKEGSRYRLTKKGFELYKKMEPKKELIEVIEDFKSFLNDMSDKEVLTFVYVSYPNFIGESAKWNELKRDRVETAIALLKKQKVSFGKAVEISGLTLDKFEDILKRNKIRWR